MQNQTELGFSERFPDVYAKTSIVNYIMAMSGFLNIFKQLLQVSFLSCIIVAKKNRTFYNYDLHLFNG
jgi:hypothetical protein